MGGRQASRPSADHTDGRVVGRRDRTVALVPHGAAAEALHPETLADEAFQRADRDRRVDLAAPAGRLARGGTHPAADRGEGVGAAGDEVGVPVASLGDRGHIGASVSVHRARGPARLVLPQPPSIWHRRCRPFAHVALIFLHMRCLAWSRRSSHAKPASMPKNQTVASATRPLRSSPPSRVTIRLGTTSSAIPSATTTTVATMALG